jgi:hypothetical protein
MMSKFYFMSSTARSPGPLMYRDSKAGDTLPRIKPMYDAFFCSKCGKVRNYDIRHEGLAVTAKINSKSDFIVAFDGDILFSSRLVEIFQKHYPNDAAFVKVEGSDFSIISPASWFRASDFPDSFRIGKPTRCCQVARGEYFGDIFPSVPEANYIFFLQHSSIAQSTTIFASEESVSTLSSYSLKGVSFLSADKCFYPRTCM